MGKKSCMVLLLFFGGLVSSLLAADCFYDSIAKLASSDELLYSRHDEKSGLIAKDTSKSDYLKIMQNIKSSGTTFACGYTRGWIAEILQGLSSQYDEFKIKSKSGWPAAGYLNVTGQKVVDLFNTKLGSPNRILYKFQIVGPLDHVWMVEQLANGGGYRVYQSYNNAFSLKAWLAKSNLKSMHGKDIIIWHDVIRMANGFLKRYNASMSDLDNLPDKVKPMRPWLVHIRDYNLTQVEGELRKAWSVIGQGRIMSKDYFYKNYLQVLANLTEAIIPFVSTTKAWTNELHDRWTSLFGAPNPVLYPGYPFNTLTAQFSQKYALEVKPLVINSTAEGKCASNAKILSDSVIDCFYDNVKKLSSQDMLLNSRLDEKIKLVAAGKSKAEFLTIMKNIKSSGQAFACGFTRSWIAETLQGLSSQYQELKTKKNNGTTAAGFLNVTGQKVVDLFNTKLGSPNRILYKFQIVGPLDHVWMVEQLAYGGGYRVYQSYNNAFSLKAWLAKSDLKSMHGKDIIIWHDVIRMANGFLKRYNASMSDLDNLPDKVKPMRPWLVHIRDYNLTQVEGELRKAWSVIGQGRIMSKDYFYKNYLQVLANLTEAIIPFVSTTKAWTNELHDRWTSLFGAPNPVLYPGYPFNTLTAQFSQKYALEVKPLVINSTAEGKCASNAKILSDSVTDCFFDTVKRMSFFDALLNSRLDEKLKLITVGTKRDDWLKVMKTIKSSGKTFSCGFTRSWITEILQGLPQQYSELVSRNNSGTAAAGFVNVTGSKVVDLFTKHLGSKQRILYKFQIVGPLDHVWLVEQLPYDGGYRVYQSYNNAYSLKAWLATEDLKSMHGRDIIIWHDVIRMASNYLKFHGGSMSDLNNLPGSVCAMKPWLSFIRNYNLTQVEANLKLAWSKFGQGKINSKDFFFKNYLHVLGNLTEKIVPFVSTHKKWTKELHDKWISLFGSPNPVLYPGFPFSQLTSQFSQKYALEVKTLQIDSSSTPNVNSMVEANCLANGATLEKSLHCFFDGVKELAAHEKKLATRLQEEIRLIKAGTNQSDFVRVMSNYKSPTGSAPSSISRYWMQVIFQGLASQYTDISNMIKGNLSAIGFTNVTGKQLLDVFNKNLGSTMRVLYPLTFTWQPDHLWLIEQLAYGRGYRVYLSNKNAFSLKAWLATDDLSSLASSDIFSWTEILPKANTFLGKYGASLSNLNKVPAYKSWMSHIRDYNISQVKSNFNMTWSMFGKGKILTKSYFYEQYLTPLSKLIDSVSRLAGTVNPWTNELDRQWILLFGSPNPWLYPGLSVSSYPGQPTPSEALQIRILKIDPLSEASCPAHIAILRRAVEEMPTTRRPSTTVATKSATTIKGVLPGNTAGHKSNGSPALMAMLFVAFTLIQTLF